MKPGTLALTDGVADAPVHEVEPSVPSLEQAAQWYAALRDDKVAEADRIAWRTWLAQSAEHRAAWARIESVSRKFEPLRGYGRQGSAAAVAGVEAARTPANGRRRALNMLAGAVGVGVLTWAGWRHTPLPELVMGLRADEHSGTGERRELLLADGSRVWLNTRSAIDVDYGSDRRRIVLRSGEILVQTAADSLERPFYVDTDHGRVRALGTRFAIRQTEDRTRLDVFEDAVEIQTRSGIALRVEAGHAAGFDADTVSALDNADPMHEAWTRGRLPADNLPLKDLLDELSRYRHGHISVAPEVAGIEVMGVFPADDPDRALAMLEETLPIRVRRSLPWWITVEAR